MKHREHPRRRGTTGRPSMFVMGGGPLPGQEDLQAGGPLEAAAAANLPADVWAGVMDQAEEDAHVVNDLADTVARLGDLSHQDAADAITKAVLWDRETAAEPYQVDLTREMDDTVRMGNNLSKAVRLELLADSLREDTLDRRCIHGPDFDGFCDRCGVPTADRPGPGFPADYPTDPVDGAELDPVDGLPIGAEDQADDHEHLPMLDGRCALCGVPLADREEDPTRTEAPPWAPLTLAAPGPIQRQADQLHRAINPTPEETAALLETITRLDGEEPPPLVTMSRAQAHTTGGTRARVLNWTSRHDPASLEYGVRSRLRAPAPLMDRVLPHGPILDQGTAPPLSLHDASGCTGHAGVNAANVMTAVIWQPSAGDLPAPLDSGDAMRLYELAQELDDVPGEAYPGTSILAVMKAGQQTGLWDSYLWAFGTRDIAQALLQVGPVIVGIPWLSGMTEPGPDGIVTVDGDDQGGHALALHGIRMSVAGRAGPWFGALQTWGEGIGDGGVIWFHHKDLARLLHGVGEAAIPIREGRWTPQGIPA